MVGFDLVRFCKLSEEQCLQYYCSAGIDYDVLVDVLLSHGFFTISCYALRATGIHVKKKLLSRGGGVLPGQIQNKPSVR